MQVKEQMLRGHTTQLLFSAAFSVRITGEPLLARITGDLLAIAGDLLAATLSAMCVAGAWEPS